MRRSKIIAFGGGWDEVVGFGAMDECNGCGGDEDVAVVLVVR